MSLFKRITCVLGRHSFKNAARNDSCNPCISEKDLVGNQHFQHKVGVGDIIHENSNDKRTKLMDKMRPYKVTFFGGVSISPVDAIANGRNNGSLKDLEDALKPLIGRTSSDNSEAPSYGVTIHELPTSAPDSNEIFSR